MHSVILNQPLYGYAMDLLEEKTNLYVAHSNNAMEFLDKLQEADAIIVRNCRIDRNILELCPRLKVLTLPGVGYQDWDLQALTEHGVAMAYCPGTNERSVAEHTIAMLYALAKNIPERNNEVKAGNYGIRNKFNAVELAGRTVGVLGLGNIGKQVARLLINNDMQVRVFDPYVSREVADAAGCIYHEDLMEMLPYCDALTFHVPLLPQNVGMFGARQLAAMKEGAYLINCARGSLVDESALYDALASGHLGGAALDVMVQEPFDASHPLFTLPNVIASPHVAGVTKEASSRTYGLAASSTLALLDGEHISNVANPDVFRHKKWQTK